MISLLDIQQAQKTIRPWVQQTPLIRSQFLSTLLKTNVYLKLEIFQTTGAFKVRGAFHKILNASDEEKQRGIVTVSAGNHGRAVACAAKALGIPASVFMPKNTLPSAIEAIKAYGAEVILAPTLADAILQAQEKQEKEQNLIVHPYDDPLVIAGQGTIGLEIYEDLPWVTDVIVSIGGGGLIAGIAVALKNICPGVRIFGVETEGAPTMTQALAAGHPVSLDKIDTIAKTLGAPIVGEDNFEIVKKYVEHVELVSERATFDAMLTLLEQVKVLTEPAASCTLAAAQQLQDRFKPDSHVVLLLCGGNISLDEMIALKNYFVLI